MQDGPQIKEETKSENPQISIIDIDLDEKEKR